MRAAEIITAVVILVVGIAMAVDSWTLGSGWGRAGPEAGFFPFWLGVLLSISASALIVQAALTRSVKGPFLSREQLVRVAKVGCPAVGALILIHWVGLYISTALYLAVYMKWVGRHSWRLVLAVSAGTPLLTFVVFEIWFTTQMPKGPLEVWLGY
ncbi:MAG: tripartite tricarboxylate transporter TctB family protein [Betaproteobacteria bacterium]|nr:tripartite tricarboxylate transporter TctB family protein [Betaproteobacteria bacterium]